MLTHGALRPGEKDARDVDGPQGHAGAAVGVT